ncbi:MAG: hypothetical protein EA391_11880 [Balneolaceae bacterium]|nr:MAG: hypothetical protein EA391_11880 [Balneolaceae bacterium]
MKQRFDSARFIQSIFYLEPFMFKLNSISVLFLFTILLSACSADSVEDVYQQPIFDPELNFFFSIEVQDQHGNQLEPSGITLFEAARGRESSPLANFQSGEDGNIKAVLDKGEPIVARVSAPHHKPLYLFIPAFGGDSLSAVIQPEPYLIREQPEPFILGNFNQFDDFNAISMQQEEDGRWIAHIDFPGDTLIYMINGFADHFQVHGTEGEFHFSALHTARQSGFESVMVRDDSDPFKVLFDPSDYQIPPFNPVIKFDKNTPISVAGVAKIYSEMIRMEDITAASGVSPNYSEFSQNVETILSEYDHPDVGLAAKLAKARFIEELGKDPEWADNVLQQVQPGSDLWKMHYPSITKLFNASTAMEEVSLRLWNLYRQQNHPALQGEALYSLLKFHYQRGEDEEWYQAHFDLVREYPGHERINYSYNRGFAPDAVMHIDRYFPDFTYESLTDPGTNLSPVDPSAVLTIIYFWDIENLQSRNHIETLKSVYRSFSEAGADIFLIALNSERERVQRFKDQNEIEWNTAAANFHDPNIQVLGVTEVPHTILLDRQNRVLINNEPFLNDERIYNLVEEYFNNLNWPE